MDEGVYAIDRTRDPGNEQGDEEEGGDEGVGVSGAVRFHGCAVGLAIVVSTSPAGRGRRGFYMWETRARRKRRGFSRDSNAVGFASGTRTQFAKPSIPIPNPSTIFIITTRSEVCVRLQAAWHIFRRQAREFAGYFYGSRSGRGVESGGGVGEGELFFDGDVEGAEVVAFAEDEAAGHGVDGEGDEDADPGGAVAEGEAEEVPVIGDPAPELLGIALALVFPLCFRSVELRFGVIWGYLGSRVWGAHVRQLSHMLFLWRDYQRR